MFPSLWRLGAESFIQRPEKESFLKGLLLIPSVKVELRILLSSETGCRRLPSSNGQNRGPLSSEALCRTTQADSCSALCPPLDSPTLRA